MYLGNKNHRIAKYNKIYLLISCVLFSVNVNATCINSETNLEAITCLEKIIEGLSLELENEKKRLTIPRHSVVAFDLSNCPSGWREYPRAYGRFIRGIDVLGTTDPDRTRAKGNLQEDAIQNHSHSIEPVKSAAHNPGTQAPHGYGSGGLGNNVASTTGVRSAKFSSETRPKNVALLYCIKD